MKKCRDDKKWFSGIVDDALCHCINVMFCNKTAIILQKYSMRIPHIIMIFCAFCELKSDVCSTFDIAMLYTMYYATLDYVTMSHNLIKDVKMWPHCLVLNYSVHMSVFLIVPDLYWSRWDSLLVLIYIYRWLSGRLQYPQCIWIYCSLALSIGVRTTTKSYAIKRSCYSYHIISSAEK